MKKASLKITNSPYSDDYGIAWNGRATASSCLAEIANAALYAHTSVNAFLDF